MSDMKQGTVKWFDNKKGYGFITPEEGGKDLFVHINNILMDGYKTSQLFLYLKGSPSKNFFITHLLTKYI